jgi:ABC-type sugar transport system permease subunit
VAAVEGDPSMARRRLLSGVYRNRHAYLFISPFYILFAVFGLYPIGYSFVLSLYKWHATKPWKFVGFQHYANLLFNDAVFWTALWNVIYIYLINVPAMLALALVIAITLNSPRQKMKNFFRLTYLLPYVASVMSVAIVFFVIFDDSLGVVNLTLQAAGLKPVHWLTSAKTSKLSIDILVTWKWTGYQMMIALAGLQSISTDIYDAAKIDGAGSWRTFWRITFPLLQPVIGFQFIITMIGTFTMFTEPYFLTDGGPGYSSLTLVLYLYRMAFKFFKLDEGAAIAFLTFLVVLIPSLFQVRIWIGRDRSLSSS